MFVIAICGVLAMLAVRPTGALASADVNWGTGVEAGLPAGGASASRFNLDVVSCSSANACGAVGDYVDSSGNFQGVLLSESSGVWSSGVEAVLPAGAASTNQSVSLNSVSCPSAGNCTAVGDYIDSSGNFQGVLLSESSGVWSSGVEAVLPAGAASTNQSVSLNSVSCSSAGNCTAVGSYTDSSGNTEGVLLSESSGVWSSGVEAVLPAGAVSTNQGVFLNSVSCPSAGDCTAVGDYVDSSGNAEGLLLTESSGVWSSGVEAVLPAGAVSTNQSVSLDSVSCPSAGNCTAIGGYIDSSVSLQGVLLSESSGVWSSGVEAVLPAGAISTHQSVSLDSVSCPSAGNCAAVGDYVDSSGRFRGLALSESAGVWATGVEAVLPANASVANPLGILDSVSCASAGNCSAVGEYADSSGSAQGLLLTESSGTWATGVEAGLPAGAPSTSQNASLQSVSCASVGDCAAIGTYVDSSGETQDLLLSAVAANPTLSVSAPGTATAGSPIAASAISAALAGGLTPTGTVSFTVFGPQSAPPASCTSGGTTVGSASVPGDGNYDAPAGFTPASPGDYWWYASYGGDASDSPAASACGASMAETVVPAPPVVSPSPPVVPPKQKPPAPVLSGVKLGAKRFAARQGTTLKLKVSEAARVQVRITQSVKGHRVKGACKTSAKQGKTCTTTVTRRSISFSAKANKASSFKLKLQGLARGDYTATVTAQNANGKSRAITLKFAITHA